MAFCTLPVKYLININLTLKTLYMPLKDNKEDSLRTVDILLGQVVALK